MEQSMENRQLRFLNPVLWETRSQELTQEIRLSDGMPDVSRVIGAWGQASVRGKEWQGNALLVNGGMAVRVLYVPEDGGMPQILEEWIPFREKWDIPEGTPEGMMRVRCLPKFVDARNVSPRKVMVRCGISLGMETLAPEKAEIASPVPTGDTLQMLKRSYPLRLSREAGEKAFAIEEEQSLGSVSGKLVCGEIRPEITETKVIADKVVFRGNGILKCLYLTEDGMLRRWEAELPFSQFCQLDGEYGSDAQAEVVLTVTGLETELTSEGILRVKCSLVGQYVVDERETLEIVEDAFDLEREVTPVREELHLPAVLECRTERISTEVSIAAEAEEILACTFWPDFPEVGTSDTGSLIRLSGQFRMLYTRRDGTVETSVSRWEDTMDFPGDGENRVLADAVSVGSAHAVMHSGEVTLSAEVSVVLRSISTRGIPMVTAMEMGEMRQKDPGRPSLILRRAAGESLWTLARTYGTTQAQIQKENDLEKEPEYGQMLLIPIP